MAARKGSVARALPDMSTTHELTYLLELASLCQLMQLHAERIQEAAADWHEHAEAARAAVELSRTYPGAGGAQGTTDAVVEMAQRQVAFWVSLDGFLSTWARASLMLWPATDRKRTADQKKASRDRGEYLRDLLQVDDTHPLNDRDLRNDWMHFDERLDDGLMRYGRITPQRFLAAGEEQPDTAAIVMRLFDLTNLQVLMANERSYSLRDLFAAARDLEARVTAAIDSMPTRRREEILARAEEGSY